MSEPGLSFPHPMLADKAGLVAIGGDLSSERLLLAYRFGIFPWYTASQPILWWSPDPRCILWPAQVIISKSMQSLLKRNQWKVTADHCFDEVISNCQNINRREQTGTWITDEMTTAYRQLHALGHAHSIEVWEEDRIVGGLYGLSLGKIFYGESMFSKISNASKFGFIRLVEFLRHQDFMLIDCQQDTPHLRSMGADLISRKDFLHCLRQNALRTDHVGSWSSWFG
ncbi:MAG: leucyl/phenylalanyl-tRNA--protein transferase [Saprospiraceae bacterium]|nr:leucyl/phenylalanyl-tRNA--protein transferase [Saprospiraceae bacterium]